MLTCTKKIGDKGEILLPKNIREETGIMPKKDVEIISFKNGIVILPLIKDIKELRGLFKKGGYKHEKKIDNILFEVMAGM